MERPHDCPALARAYCAALRLQIMSEKNDPASVGALPGHGPNNPHQETEMDSQKDTSKAAAAASTSVRNIVDQLGYAVNDMRMFASVLETIISAKLGHEESSVLLLPGVEGLHLYPIEAEEIIFLALKLDAMARKVNDEYETLCRTAYSSNARAA